MDKRAIGIFDSGVGGMTVLSDIRKKLPNEDLIYLGDTKNFPYGDKSKETIIKLATKCVEFLIQRDVKLIVIACGTATSQALRELRKIFNIPIIGIITPTVLEIKEKMKQNKSHIVGVIATEGTIRSNQWEEELRSQIEHIEVINQACPLLAPMAEQGWIQNKVAEETIKEYMKPFLKKNINELILGCTHYPLFKKLIQKELGSKVEIINTGEKIAIYLEKYLMECRIENKIGHKGKYQYFLTDVECNFIKVAKVLLENEEIEPKIRKENIE